MNDEFVIRWTSYLSLKAPMPCIVKIGHFYSAPWGDLWAYWIESDVPPLDAGWWNDDTGGAFG